MRKKAKSTRKPQYRLSLEIAPDLTQQGGQLEVRTEDGLKAACRWVELGDYALSKNSDSEPSPPPIPPKILGRGSV